MNAAQIKHLALLYVNAQDEVRYLVNKDVVNNQTHIFRRVIADQFADLSKVIYFDFVQHKPYSYTNVEEMLEDFDHGTIKVNTSGNDSLVWGEVYNLMFRAIHDYVHCVKVLPFTYEGEVSAFKNQMSFSRIYLNKYPDADHSLYEALLRSEIVYQAAVKETFSIFDLPEQKIILNKFDY